MYLPERHLQLSSKKLEFGRYPLDAIVIEADWEGWEGLRDYHPALLNDTQVVRLVKGPVGSGAQAGKRVRDVSRSLTSGELEKLTPLQAEVFTRYGVQGADIVRGRTVQIAPEAFARLPKADHYRVTCPATKCSFIVSRKEISTYPEGSEPEGTIKLSRYQRILLRLYPPLDFEELLHGTLTPEAVKVIDGYYTAEDGGWPRVRSDGLLYPEMQTIMRALKQAHFFTICITPLVQEPESSLFAGAKTRGKRFARLRRIWYWVAQKYVGSRDHMLRVVRPYDIDESRAAVRLSPDSMTSLGIEETDLVRIRYGKHSIVARAMAITDEDRFRMNSYISQAETLDAVIGIPVGLRTKLGVPGINESVRVDRDVNYLLQKTLNIYVLSALAWLLTLLQVVPSMGISMWWTAVAFILALPLIVFAAAAPKRAQVRDAE